MLAQVEIAGKVIKGDDKITCEKMRILHAYRWEKRDSVEMSVYAAELVVENFEKVFPNDTRVRDTINLVNKYLTDPSSVTEDKLRSAWSAAWSAGSAAESAESAAWSAESAESAARSAALSAESAAWSAADARHKGMLRVALGGAPAGEPEGKEQGDG